MWSFPLHCSNSLAEEGAPSSNFKVAHAVVALKPNCWLWECNLVAFRKPLDSKMGQCGEVEAAKDLVVVAWCKE